MLNYLLFNLFLFLQKSKEGGWGGLKAPLWVVPERKQLKKIIPIEHNIVKNTN